MTRPLCIYHGNCADGFGAAWVVRKFFNGEVDFHHGVYNDPPPDTEWREVIFVDFSYKRDVMIKLADRAHRVLLLDHHKSAAEDLKADNNYIVDLGTYEGRVDWWRFLVNCEQDRMEGGPYARIYSLFDMQRSGAGIAWDFFFPDQKRPRLIDRIEDRDLWRFQYPDTRAVQAAVFSYPYDFDVWDALAIADTEKLRTEGEAIERKHHKDIAELVTTFRREMIIGGHWVPAANLPYTLTSDAGSLMCKPYASPQLQGEIVTPPFAACWWVTTGGVVFSLRSVEGGADVAEIATAYGGGGHRNASGFRVTTERFAKEFLCAQ